MLVSVVLPLVLLTGARLVRSGVGPHPRSSSAPRSSPPSASRTPPSSSCPCSSPASSWRPWPCGCRGARCGSARGLVYPLAAGAVLSCCWPRPPPPRPSCSPRASPSTSGATRVTDPLRHRPGHARHPRRHLPGHRARRPGHPQRRAAARRRPARSSPPASPCSPACATCSARLGPHARSSGASGGSSPCPCSSPGSVGAVTGRLAERPRAVVAAAAVGARPRSSASYPSSNGRWVGHRAQRRAAGLAR